MVDDNLQTSAPDVFAIGECASWKGNYYGLIAPGSMDCFFHGLRPMLILSIVEMADILSFNLTETESHAPRKMNSPDLSTKLKCVSDFTLNPRALSSYSDLWASMSRLSETFSQINE